MIYTKKLRRYIGPMTAAQLTYNLALPPIYYLGGIGTTSYYYLVTEYPWDEIPSAPNLAIGDAWEQHAQYAYTPADLSLLGSYMAEDAYSTLSNFPIIHTNVQTWPMIDWWNAYKAGRPLSSFTWVATYIQHPTTLKYYAIFEYLILLDTDGSSSTPRSPLSIIPMLTLLALLGALSFVGVTPARRPKNA